jgi:hypothetical protein
MTLCKRVKTASGNKRHYTFPNGELVVYVGTKKACLFLIDGLTYLTKAIDRKLAANALKQLKRECKGVTSDEVIQGEV